MILVCMPVSTSADGADRWSSMRHMVLSNVSCLDSNDYLQMTDRAHQAERWIFHVQLRRMLTAVPKRQAALTQDGCFAARRREIIWTNELCAGPNGRVLSVTSASQFGRKPKNRRPPTTSRLSLLRLDASPRMRTGEESKDGRASRRPLCVGYA